MTDFGFNEIPQPNPPAKDKSNDADPDASILKDQIKERYEQDTKWRSKLSWWVIGVDSIWLIAIIAILFFNKKCFELSDNVLMVLLGTTTINVLGLAHIVLRGLFQVKSK